MTSHKCSRVTDASDVQPGFLYFEGEYGNVKISNETGTADYPWEVTILADGWIDISGNPHIANYENPDHPLIVQALMLVSDADIKISGNPNQTYNGIVAAAEQIQISGNATVEGVLIAADRSNDSVLVVENKISGRMIMSYDGGLEFPETEGDDNGKVFALSWRDLEIARNADVFAAVAEIEPIDPQGY